MSQEQFNYFMAMSYKRDLSYQEIDNILRLLEKQDLMHTRQGFNYWVSAFKEIPSVEKIEDVDNLIKKYIISESEHACTVLHTVNMAMRFFTNALANKYHQINPNGESFGDRSQRLFNESGNGSIDEFENKCIKKHAVKNETNKKIAK